MSKWINIWDDKFNITGSVYLTPAYSSGPENGLSVYDAPATKHFTPGQGAPARHVNYALFQLGDDRVKADQHIGMTFRGSGTWAPKCVAVARSNGGFLIGSSTSVCVTEDAVNTNQLILFTPAVTGFGVVHDDGYNVVGIESGAGGGVAHFSHASTVSTTTFAGFTYPMAAVTIGSNTMLLGTTGSATTAWTYPSTTANLPTATSVSVPAASFGSSSTSLWGTSQVYLGAYTATGPALLYTKGSTANGYLFTSDAVTLAAKTFNGTTPGDELIDIAYDDVQSVFVAAFYTAVSGTRIGFQISADGVNWTTSTTAQGPLNFEPAGVLGAGTISFKICSGIWFIVTTQNIWPNFVFGASSAATKQVTGIYSLDYGKTWYRTRLNLNTASVSTTLQLKASVNRFVVIHDSDVAVSGTLGYPELLT